MVLSNGCHATQRKVPKQDPIVCGGQGAVKNSLGAKPTFQAECSNLVEPPEHQQLALERANGFICDHMGIFSEREDTATVRVTTVVCGVCF